MLVGPFPIAIPCLFPLGLWHLLGDAVDVSGSDLCRLDANNVSAREQWTQSIQGQLVPFGLAKLRNYYCLVRNVEVDIGCWKPFGVIPIVFYDLIRLVQPVKNNLTQYLK